MRKGDAQIRSKSRDKKQLKRDELQREIEYSRVTLSKAVKEWKSLCAKVCHQRLTEDVICAWNSFDKMIDQKDFIISLYLDDVENNEEIYMNNFRNHQDKMSEILEAFSETIYDIHARNNDQLQQLIRTSFEDCNKQAIGSETSENYLKVMTYGLTMLRKRTEKLTKTENFAKLNEESTRCLDDIQELTYSLEYNFEDMWYRMGKCEENFIKDNMENKKRHDAIKRIEDTNKATINRELKKLNCLYETSKHLTLQYKNLVNTLGKKLKHLEEERDILHEFLFQLRKKLVLDKETDSVKRTSVTVEFTEAFEYLQEIMKKGEIMVKTLRVLRRYETEKEKLLPYPVGDSTECKNCIPELTLFSQRLGIVEASRYALNEERMFLKQENDRLKQEIHTFCECLSCPVAPPILNRSGKIPYTEGSDMIRKVNTHNRCLKVPYTPDDDEPKIEDGDDNPK